MSLDDLFHATFTADIQNDLVECIQSAYSASSHAHDPSVGHDAASFGFLNYKSRVHFLRQLQDEDRGIAVARLHPFFSLQVGDFKLSAYNAGDSTETELAKCFPRNKGRARKLASLNAQQLTLDLNLPSEEDDSNCRHLILCDLGDAINGLRCVFIGVPVQTENGKISRWSRVYPIWESAALDFAPETAPLAPTPVAPVEIIEPVKLVLRQKPHVTPTIE